VGWGGVPAQSGRQTSLTEKIQQERAGTKENFTPRFTAYPGVGRKEITLCWVKGKGNRQGLKTIEKLFYEKLGGTGGTERVYWLLVKNWLERKRRRCLWNEKSGS